MEDKDKKELRQYIDTIFKPKKPGMKNLDREMIVYKIETIISSKINKIKEKAMQIKYAKHNPSIDCDCEDCRVAEAILEAIN